MVSEPSSEKASIGVFQPASLTAVPYRLVDLSQVRAVGAHSGMEVEGQRDKEHTPA